MQNRHTLDSAYLSVSVLTEGAEMCSLQDASGQELLWQARDAWAHQASNLFPIVGELADGAYLHQGRRYEMRRHGFARDKKFAWLQRTPTRCRLVLHDDAQTRALYPFAFRFEGSYALDDDVLEIGFTIANTGRVVLPASAGAHPAFIWPLAEGVAKTDHVLEFSAVEAPMIRRINPRGLLRAEAAPSPIRDGI